jgi:hypothetical protein
MATSSSAVPALAGAPADSSSVAASAVAAVKSSAKAKVTKQRIMLNLPPEHKKCVVVVVVIFDVVRSELGSLGVDDLSPTVQYPCTGAVDFHIIY